MNQTLQKVAYDMGGRTGCAYEETWDNCHNFWKIFLSELKVQRKCDDKNGANECMPDYEFMPFNAVSSNGFNYLAGRSAYILSDGTILRYYGSYGPLFLLDINGKKGPNKACYDVYIFSMIYENNKYKYSSSYICDGFLNSSKFGDSKGLHDFKDIDKW